MIRGDQQLIEHRKRLMMIRGRTLCDEDHVSNSIRITSRDFQIRKKTRKVSWWWWWDGDESCICKTWVSMIPSLLSCAWYSLLPRIFVINMLITYRSCLTWTWITCYFRRYCKFISSFFFSSKNFEDIVCYASEDVFLVFPWDKKKWDRRAIMLYNHLSGLFWSQTPY
jgi:hypothetical protein